MTFRAGNNGDLDQLRLLGLAAWEPYQQELTSENWAKLFANLDRTETYAALLEQGEGVVCEAGDGSIVGMAFLIPSGNPTEIYQADWCYIRFVSVHPACSGRGIGRQLTEKCIELAILRQARTIALHTSEMMPAARHLYERLGFTILREIEPRLGKRYWLYTLALA